jgi:hypothetical protein
MKRMSRNLPDKPWRAALLTPRAGILKNGLGKPICPKPVLILILARCERQRHCKAGSGRFRFIRMIGSP